MKISLNLEDMLLVGGGAILAVVLILFAISMVMSKGNFLIAVQIMGTLVKKYWAVALIVIAGVTVLIMKKMLEKKVEDVVEDVKKTDMDVDKIKTKVSNASREAAIGIAVAKSKDKEKKKKLDEIKKIDDEYEKAKALADLL